jgi:hypothetical protein
MTGYSWTIFNVSTKHFSSSPERSALKVISKNIKMKTMRNIANEQESDSQYLAAAHHHLQ